MLDPRLQPASGAPSSPARPALSELALARPILSELALACSSERVTLVEREPDEGAASARSLDPRALAGRLCELCGEHASATLTQACALVRRAQDQGASVGWIGARGSSFFPPDVEAAGVDLDALAVVRVPKPRDLATAADLLARSGAFDLVVLDLAATQARLPLFALTRLSGLARAHDCAIVFLTRKRGDEPSLGSLISLRGDVRQRRTHTGWVCELSVTKDRRHPGGWSRREECHGPPGLC